MLIRIVGIFSLWLSCQALALVPVEGIMMGDAPSELQQDPLAHIFQDIYDTSQQGENKKIKMYFATYQAGEALLEQCPYLAAPTYATSWEEKQARRSVAATLQYVGLDQSIKAIGAYARKLNVSAEDYRTLKENLVRNYCSRNLTVYSVRQVDKALDHYYQTPFEAILPTVASSPFASEAFKNSTSSPEAKSREFDLAINNFRAFCSWGGDVGDYRMLTPYLNNPFIMSFINQNLRGQRQQYNSLSQSVEIKAEGEMVQVSCDDLICRKVPREIFEKNFPLSIGSTGLGTDLTKLYCHHFRQQDYYSGRTIPEVKKWIKEVELEDAVYESNFFISLLTGVPNPIVGISKFAELPFLLKSSIDERWNKWASEVLNIFSHDLLFEESIKVKVSPRRGAGDLALHGFKVNLFVTLGELDRVMDETDKISMSFSLKLSKNLLRQLRGQWRQFALDLDESGQIKLKQDLALNIDQQLKAKEKHFKQSVWNQDFSRLMAEEILGQVMVYQGSLFDSYQEEMLNIPVSFHYGPFALGYMRYRADVHNQRLKLNL